MQEFSADKAAQMLRGNKQRNRAFYSLPMADKIHKNISSYTLRQIAIVRQMVYNILGIFDTSRNLAMG